MRVQDWFLELCSLTEQRTRNLQSASDTTYFPLAMLIACTTEPTGGMRIFSPFSIHVRFSLDGQYGTRKFNGCPMTSKRLLCAALLLAGSSLLLATPGSAQTPPPHGHPPGHGGPPGGHSGPHFAFHHDFAHFSAGERAAWVGGRWNHAWHNGRYGWWWFAGGAWYFYDFADLSLSRLRVGHLCRRRQLRAGGPVLVLLPEPTGLLPLCPPLLDALAARACSRTAGRRLWPGPRTARRLRARTGLQWPSPRPQWRPAG